MPIWAMAVVVSTGAVPPGLVVVVLTIAARRHHMRRAEGWNGSCMHVRAMAVTCGVVTILRVALLLVSTREGLRL